MTTYHYESKVLRKVLKALKPYIGTVTRSPILANVAIQGKVFIASDLDVTCAIHHDSFEEGIATTLNLKQLQAAVEAGKKATTVALNIISETQHALTTTLTTPLPALPIREFPEFLLPPNTQTRITIDYKKLMGLAKFASDDSSMSTLQQIHVSKETGELVATDGGRLHRALTGVSLPAGEVFEGMLIKASVVAKLGVAMKALGIEPQTVQAYQLGEFKKTFLVVKCDGYTIHIIATDTYCGQYPRYNQLIPTDPTYSITFSVADMLLALAEVKPFLPPRTNIVTFNFHKEVTGLTLSTKNLEAVTVGSLLPVTYNTKDVKQEDGEVITKHWDIARIGFNHTYWVDCLNSYKSWGVTEVTLSTNSSLSPALITPVDHRNDTHLIMPIDLK